MESRICFVLREGLVTWNVFSNEKKPLLAFSNCTIEYPNWIENKSIVYSFRRFLSTPCTLEGPRRRLCVLQSRTIFDGKGRFFLRNGKADILWFLVVYCFQRSTTRKGRLYCTVSDRTERCFYYTPIRPTISMHPVLTILHNWNWLRNNTRARFQTAY